MSAEYSMYLHMFTVLTVVSCSWLKCSLYNLREQYILKQILANNFSFEAIVLLNSRSTENTLKKAGKDMNAKLLRCLRFASKFPAKFHKIITNKKGNVVVLTLQLFPSIHPPPPHPPPPSPFCGFLAVVSFAFVKVTYDIRQVLSRSKPLDLVSLENIICCEDPTGSESIFPYPTIVEYKTLSSKSKRSAYFAGRLNFC